MLADHRSSMQLFVDRVQQRSRLSDSEAGALLTLSGSVSIARANEDIVSPGTTTVHTCLVLDGLAGWFGQVIDGRRQITALHIAGDMCDLNSLVMPEADWALQALSPTAILRIPHAQMLEVARSYPNIAEAFWRDCSADASILLEWLINVGRRDARSRLAHLLCEMAIRLENAGLGNRREFRLQATQTQLGDALGLTPVHINRTVQTLRRMELVTLRAHEVRILDWDRLAGLGDFDEDYLQMGVRDASRGPAFDRAGPQVANA